jgi:hypothetical protein
VTEPVITEERIREIIADEIGKISLSVNVSSNGYGDTFYVDARLDYHGTISESHAAFTP